MKAKIITINPYHLQAELLQPAAAALRQGKLIAFPTETVYGLGANALDRQAVDRIFTAKNRPAYDPLIVHLAATDWLPQIALDIPSLVWKCAEAFLPGPLTLIVPKHPALPDNVTAQRPTVAVRIPAHPIALALINEAQVPVAAPSANRFGHVSPTCAQHVLNDLGDQIDYLIDGGDTAIGIESTVLDLTAPLPTILRPGGVTYEQLTNVLGEVAIAAHTATSKNPLSPGMLPQHYSPRANLFYIEIPNRSAALDILKQIADDALQQGKSIGLLLVEEDLKLFNGIPAQQASLGSETNLWQAAQRLYAALRFLDDQGVSIILARDLGGLGPGLAIRDRLRRAAKKIIYDAEKPF